MPKKSCFQWLPQHIVRDIVLYVADNRCAGSPNQLLQPLLALCRQWREETLSIKYANCVVSVKDKLCFSSTLLEASTEITPDAALTYGSYARTVLVEFGFASIIDQSAAKKLSAGIASGLGFCGAHVLNTKILISNDRYADTTEFVDKFQNLLMYIGKLLPSSATKNKLSLETNVPTDAMASAKQVDALAQYVLDHQQFSRVNLGHLVELPSSNNCIYMSALSVFSCQWDSNYQLKTRIIHTYARSLQQLFIYYVCSEGFESLITNEDKETVVFPYLQVLCLAKEQEVVLGELMCPKLAVPFPRLKILEVDIDYPFRDDIFFRGNASFLKQILLTVDDKRIQNLIKNGVFTNARLGSLTQLSLCDISRVENTKETGANDYTGLYESLLCHLQGIYFVSNGLAYSLIRHINTSQCFYFIDTLAIPGSRVSLVDCVKLLEHLPVLRAIDCTITNYGSEFKGMNVLQIANVLRQKYRPLNRSLQRWVCKYSENVSIHVISAVILLLADVCPYLRVVDLIEQSKSGADQVFTKLISSKLYGKFKKTIVPPICPVLDTSGYFTTILLKRDAVVTQN